MSGQTAAVGRKDWFQRARSSAKTVIGLTVIFVAVFYLLAGFMAALDATAFQERILRLVGDNNIDRARSVLTKLDELSNDASPLESVDDGSLPIGALALQLDRVKLLTADLARFDDALREVEPVPSQSEPAENGGGKADPTLEALLLGMGTDLLGEFDALDASLEEAIPGVAVTRSLEEIKKTTSDLAAIDIASLSTNEFTETEAQALVDLDGALANIKRELLVLGREAPPDHPEAKTINDSLETATSKITELRTLATGPFSSLANGIDTAQGLRDDLAAELDKLDGLLTTAQPALLQASFTALDTSVVRLNRALGELRLLSDPSSVTNESTRSVPTENETVDPKAEIARLAQLTGTLSSAVNAALPSIEAVQQLTPSLAQMEFAVERLAAMGVNREGIHTKVGDLQFEGLPPDELFREQLALLSTATRAMAVALAGVSAQGKIAMLLPDDAQANYKAGVILADFRSFERYGFPWNLQLPLNLGEYLSAVPASLAVASRETLDMLLVLIIGAIGSMIYMTQYILRLAIDGESSNPNKAMPVSWYLFRPIFGAFVAFALYRLYKTGQVALGSGGLSAALQSGVNIPILAVLGLFAGLLSWQVLEMIQSKGETWLAGVERRNLWATGLLRALEAKEHTPESCARHVGYTVGQIDRWISLEDQVTPEMQDRVSTWLGIKRDEIFSALAPSEARRDRSMFARGLEPYLQRADARYDEASIAKALAVEPEVVVAWREQRRAVSSDLQWTLVELLGERYADFYSSRSDPQKYWAVGWRSLDLPDEFHTADQLAARLGVAASLVREWRDLKQPVPAKTAATLAELFAVVPEKLFDPEFERAGNRFRAKEQALRDAIDKAFGPSGNVSPIGAPRAAGSAGAAPSQQNAITAFAVAVDVPDDEMQSWLKGEKIYRPTCEAICRLLGEPFDVLFDKLD